ncbi:MAG: gliding motility lipoprotein GldH [Odoribacter sp.]|nr:gliding motility lipoprotein GldH [Odoribacter sp.]
MKGCYIISLFILLFSACRSDVVFEDYQELSGENWDYNHVLEFNAHIPDSGLYQVTLYVRHTSNFEMTNLWCIISTRSQALQQLHDTVNMKIATPTGDWFGEGGQMKTVSQAINKNPVIFPQGNVLFRIEQGMKPENLRGVKNVGICIEKVKDNIQSR